MTRIALALLALAAGAVYMLRRSFRVEPDAGALPDCEDGEYIPMAAWMPDSDTYHFGTTLNITRAEA